MLCQVRYVKGLIDYKGDEGYFSAVLPAAGCVGARCVVVVLFERKMGRRDYVCLIDCVHVGEIFGSF